MRGNVRQGEADFAGSETHRQKDAWQVADSAGSETRGNVRQDEADSEGSEACRQGKSPGKIKCPVSRNEQ